MKSIFAENHWSIGTKNEIKRKKNEIFGPIFGVEKSIVKMGTIFLKKKKKKPEEEEEEE